MNRITPAQVHAIQLAHADGLLDNAIARRAGVSRSTVKRVRKEHGLATHCVTAIRGRKGEEKVAEAAILTGLSLEIVWRKRDNDKHDLTIADQRVDVKASMQLADGSWKFRLPTIRASNSGQYRYPKDYERDCELLALVCEHPDGREPSIYLLSSSHLPRTIRIRPGQTYQDALEAWHLFTPAVPSTLAA